MKKKNYMPYNFDEKYEFKTYKNIGRSSKIYYCFKKNLFLKMYYKLWNNEIEKRYKNYNTYSEWEKFILSQVASKYDYNLEYYNNFVHFLKEKKRHYEFGQSVINSIFIPILLLLATGVVTILLGNDFIKEECSFLLEFEINWFIFGLIVIMIFIIAYIFKVRNNKYYYFYKDYIEILEAYESENTSHQK